MLSNRGFSLIEALISIGLMSMVIMAFMHVTDNQNAANERMEAKMRQMGLVQDLRTQLSTSRGCTDALKVQDYKLEQDGSLKLAFDMTPTIPKDPLVRAGSVVADGRLRIMSVDFKNASLVDSDAGTGERTYIGDLMVQMNTERGAKFSFPETTAGKIHFTVNKAGRITDCGATTRGIASGNTGGHVDTTACAMPADKAGNCCPKGTVSTSCSQWSAPGQPAQTICRCEPDLGKGKVPGNGP